MKIGDLITVKPAKGSLCIITKLNVSGVSNCVEIFIPEERAYIPMDKKWIEVIGENELTLKKKYCIIGL